MIAVTTPSKLTIDRKLSRRAGASSNSFSNFYGGKLSPWIHEQRAMSDAIMVGANLVHVDAWQRRVSSEVAEFGIVE